MVRTTSSAAILAIEYVGMIGRWLSPSAAARRARSTPAGSYTPVEEQCRNAPGRTCAISSPGASALARRSRSQRWDFTTAKFRTASTPVGTVGEVGVAEVGGDARDARRLEPLPGGASVKRATPITSWSAASGSRPSRRPGP